MDIPIEQVSCLSLVKLVLVSWSFLFITGAIFIMFDMKNRGLVVNRQVIYRQVKNLLTGIVFVTGVIAYVSVFVFFMIAVL